MYKTFHERFTKHSIESLKSIQGFTKHWTTKIHQIFFGNLKQLFVFVCKKSSKFFLFLFMKWVPPTLDMEHGPLTGRLYIENGPLYFGQYSETEQFV